MSTPVIVLKEMGESGGSRADCLEAGGDEGGEEKRRVAEERNGEKRNGLERKFPAESAEFIIFGFSL